MVRVSHARTPDFDGSREHVVLSLGSMGLQIRPAVSNVLWDKPNSQCRSAHLTRGARPRSITAPISGNIFADNRK